MSFTRKSTQCSPAAAAAAAADTQLLRALLWLLAGSGAGGGRGAGGGDEDAGAKEEVLQIASKLASFCDGGASAEDLFSRHFTELLEYVVAGGTAAADGVGPQGAGGAGGHGGWGKGSRRRTGFEALLRSAPAAVGGHLGEVMPIFRGLLHDATR